MDLKHIAKLSKIALTEEEYEKFQEDMKDIIELTDRVREVKSDKNSRAEAVCYSLLREDSVIETENTKIHFEVPRVI